MFDFLFNPQGRISRKGFWLGFFLPYLAITVALSIGEQAVPALGVVSLLVGLFYLWPSLVAVPVKRLHDLGRSGWWLLLFYALIVAALVGFSISVGAYVAGLGAGTTDALGAMTVQERQAFFTANVLPALGTPASLLAGLLLAGLVIAYYVVMGVLRGRRGDNRYGRDPHAEGRGFAD